MKYERNSPENTIRCYKADLVAIQKAMEAWHAPVDRAAITQTRIYAYIHDSKFKAATQHRKLASIRTFFNWLEAEGIVKNNPATDVDSPYVPHKQPHFLPIETIISFIETPDITDNLGVRDCAMLEGMYGCGVKVEELVKLRLQDIDFNEQTVRVLKRRAPARVLPLSQHATKAIKDYLGIRRHFQLENEGWSDKGWNELKDSDAQSLFLNYQRTCITTRSVARMIKKYAQQLNLSNVSPNTLRHSFAIHMTQAGSDVAVLQKMMGLARASSLGMYAEFSPHRGKFTKTSCRNRFPLCPHRQTRKAPPSMNHLRPVLIEQLKKEGFSLVTEASMVSSILDSFNFPFEYLQFHFWIQFHPAFADVLTNAFISLPDDTTFAYQIIADEQSLAYSSENEYLTWQSGGITIGTGGYTRRHETSNESIVTAKSLRITRQLKKLGFTLVHNNIRAIRTTIRQGDSLSEEFGITGQDIYQRAGLRLTISHTTSEQPTLEAAKRHAGLRASLATHWVIPGGKGQKKLAARVGNAICERIQREVGIPTSIEGIYVLCATRGGRGAYKQKTSRVWFSLKKDKQ